MSRPQDCVPTVFIVDDDDAVRRALQLLLKTLGVPAQGFASAAKFLEAYDPARGGCVLLDVRMPGMSGLEMQEELNRRGATIPVIFITGHGDVPMAVEAIQQGAFDFLQKPFREQELIDRVQRALVRDREQREHLNERDQIRARMAALTPRELQILQMVTEGKANKVMAGDLGVSQRTVEIHRANLMEKMQAASLAQLVRMKLSVDETEA